MLKRTLSSFLAICIASLPASAGLHLHGSVSQTALPASGSIVAHFDSTTIGGSNGIKFSSWTDTVSGIVAAQATSGSQPTFTSNRLNGLPSAQFGGAAFMTVAAPGAMKTALDSGVYSVMIVFRTLGSTASGFLFSACGASNSDLSYQADGTGVGRGVGANYVAYPGQTSFSTIGSTITNTYAGISSSANYENSFINGGGVGVSNANVVTGNNTIAIGGNGAGSFLVNAEIFDIVVWNVQLTPTQVLQFEMWAADKFAQPYPWAGLSAFTIFDGDSITANLGASGIAGGYPYKAAQTLGLSFGQWSNLGVGGITPPNMDILAANRIDNVAALINKNVHLASFEWFNQRNPSPTPFNQSAAYLANRKAASSRTKIAFGDSTDSTTDDANGDANRGPYNTAIASVANADQHVIVSTDAHIGVTGSATADNNVTYFSDGLHLKDAGYTVLASYFSTALALLP